jgi:hypothetical protein
VCVVVYFKKSGERQKEEEFVFEIVKRNLGSETYTIAILLIITKKREETKGREIIVSIRKYVQNFINSRVCFDHHHIIKRNDGGAAEKPKSPIMQSSKRILSIQKIGLAVCGKRKLLRESQVN